MVKAILEGSLGTLNISETSKSRFTVEKLSSQFEGQIPQESSVN